MTETIAETLAQIRSNANNKRAQARAHHLAKGRALPFRDPMSVNGWCDDCANCGAEITFGWDDGFAFPSGVTLEAECHECGWEFEFPICGLDVYFDPPRTINRVR